MSGYTISDLIRHEATFYYGPDEDEEWARDHPNWPPLAQVLARIEEGNL